MLSTALGDSSRRAVAAGPHSRTRGYNNLLWILWYTPARWQRGCVPDASRVGDTVQWIAWKTRVLPC